MKNNEIIGIFLFLTIIFLAVLSDKNSTLIVIFGGLFSVIVFFKDRLSQANQVSMQASPKEGLKFEYVVRRSGEVKTIIPELYTDSSNNEESIRLNNLGRKLISQSDGDNFESLQNALTAFQDAVRLDVDYWEPQLNAANVYFLLGEVEKAVQIADRVQTHFAKHPLAMARAALVKAKALEKSLPENPTETELKETYQKIVGILQQSRAINPKHTTTLISLGRAMLLSGDGEGDLRRYLGECASVEGFMVQFENALASEGLLEDSHELLPEFFGSKSEISQVKQ